MPRTLSFAAVNGIYVGPLVHTWFGSLEALVDEGGALAAAPKWQKVVAQTAIDQTVGAVAILSSLYVVVALGDAAAHGALAGPAGAGVDADALAAALGNAVARMQTELPATLQSNWRLWPAANLVNFALVPPPLRVLFANVVSVFWNIYLSGAMHHAAP